MVFVGFVINLEACLLMHTTLLTLFIDTFLDIQYQYHIGILSLHLARSGESFSTCDMVDPVEPITVVKTKLCVVESR